MSLHVCSTSTDDVLTTTAYVKALIGTTLTSDDALINSMIRAASRWAERYVGYPMAGVQSYQETLPGMGMRNLMVSRTPVRAVPRVWDSTTTSTADGAQGTQVQTSQFGLEAEHGFLTRDRGWAWSASLMGRILDLSIPIAWTPMAGQETRPWLVDYTAGYTYGGVDTGSSNYSTVAGTTSTGRTLPEDVEMAVALKAIALRDGTERVSAEQLGDLKVNYRSAGEDETFREPYEVLLEPYRRMA